MKKKRFSIIDFTHHPVLLLFSLTVKLYYFHIQIYQIIYILTEKICIFRCFHDYYIDLQKTGYKYNRLTNNTG